METHISLLYFSTQSSGPARRMEGFLDQVLQERRNHETFTRRAIDIDREPGLAEHFGVQVVPTIVVVDAGREAARIEGRRGVGELRDALAPWLK